MEEESSVGRCGVRKTVVLADLLEKDNRSGRRGGWKIVVMAGLAGGKQ